MRVRGDAVVPPSIGGRFSILCAILRQLALVISVGVVSNELKQLDPDVIFVDQLSACIPLFRLICPKAKVLFYGHFPDRLLTQEGVGLMKHVKRAYRLPFDSVEAWSTGCADEIAVNSKFTRSVFRTVFKDMRKRELKVIYPCVDTSVTTATKSSPIWHDKKILLSINRFEGKKNLGLAIKAYAGLTLEEKSEARLILAGGYDSRVHENSATHKALQQLAELFDLRHTTLRGNQGVSAELAKADANVSFLLSISQDLKQQLLQEAALLIYTPENEHFGIVPLEAMLAEVPVLATNTGGPLETIYDGRTGWLRSPTKIEQWTDVMRKPLIPSSAGTLQQMGIKGRERVISEFSKTKMTNSLDEVIRTLCTSKAKRPPVIPMLISMISVTAIAVIAALLALGTFWWKANIDHDPRERG